MYQGRVRLTVSSKCIECVSICIEPLTSSYPPQAYPERYICIEPVSTTYRCCIDTIETSLAVLSEHNDTHSIHVRYELGVLTPQCGGPAYRSRIVSKLYRSCIVRAPELRIDAVSEVGIVFVSSMYRSLITIQYPRCIECVSKWYRKTIQYRSPDGAKNVSCLYRKCIEQKVSRYCIEREISKITIHIRYTSIQFDTVRYIYRENAPRYIGKKAPFPCHDIKCASNYCAVALTRAYAPQHSTTHHAARVSLRSVTRVASQRGLKTPCLAGGRLVILRLFSF